MELAEIAVSKYCKVCQGLLLFQKITITTAITITIRTKTVMIRREALEIMSLDKQAGKKMITITITIH